MGLRFVLPTFTENKKKKTNKQPSLSLNTHSLQLASNTESLPLTAAESNVAFEARRERHLHPKALSMHPGGLIQLMGFSVSIVRRGIMLSDLPPVQSFAFEGLGGFREHCAQHAACTWKRVVVRVTVVGCSSF